MDIRLQRKSLFLLADLAEQSRHLRGGQPHAVMKTSSTTPDSVNLFNERLLKAVVNLMEASDMDTKEKVSFCSLNPSLKVTVQCSWYGHLLV